MEGFAYIPLPNHDDVLAIVRQLRAYYNEIGITDVEWQAAPTYHITLAYAPIVDEEILRRIAMDVRMTTPLEIEGIFLDIFEDGDTRALHIRLERTPTVTELQKAVVAEFRERGVELSPFSEPAQWKPHITLAYLPQGVQLPENTRVFFQTRVSRVVFGQDNYEPIAEVDAITFKQMKDDEMSVLEQLAEISGIEDPQFSAIAINTALSMKDRIQQLLGRGEKTSMVFKSKHDDLYMLIRSTNNFRDVDGDIITYDALEQNLKWIYDDEIYTPFRVHKFYHWDDDTALPIGDVIAETMVGDQQKGATYFMLTKARNNPIARAIYTHIGEQPSEWGASIGFLHPAGNKNGIFGKALFTEVSSLKRIHVANKITSTEVFMTKNARDVSKEAFNEIMKGQFGIEGAFEALEKGENVLLERLNEMGLEHKSAKSNSDEATDDKVIQSVVSGEMLDAFQKAVKSQNAIESVLKSWGDNFVAEIKALKDEMATTKGELDTVKKALSQQVELNQKQQAFMDALPKGTAYETETKMASLDIATLLRTAKEATKAKSTEGNNLVSWGGVQLPKDLVESDAAE